MERLAGRVILLWGWRRAVVAFAAGALAVLAQAPYDFFAVCFVSFPVLVWLLDGATVYPPAGFVRRLAPAFATGWWFGFGYFVAGLWWVGGALLVEADSFAWAMPFAVLGLPAVLAIFFGGATALARLFWTNDIGRIAALAAAFGLFELLRTVLFTGFPWNPVGYAAMPVPVLMQSAAVAGTVGMNVLAVFVFSVPALLAAHRHVAFGFALAIVLAALHVAYGFVRLDEAGDGPARKVAVRIVQPAIDQSEKWDASVRDRIFAGLLDLSKAPPAAGQARADVIVWPETSVPYLLTERPQALAAIGDMLQPGQMLLAGVVRGEAAAAGGEALYYNSLTAINDAGEIAGSVDKVHLVPFGEYLPLSGLLEWVGLRKVVTLPLNFASGTTRQPITLPGGARAAAFICYEIIFPSLVFRDTADADVIVSVTNDAWFGDTPGPYQHFRQAQIRAVETGRPVLRSANTGISGVIDSYGRIVDALALGARGTIDATVEVSAPPRTSVGTPVVNGYAVLALFALAALGFKARQHLGSN